MTSQIYPLKLGDVPGVNWFVSLTVKHEKIALSVDEKNASLTVNSYTFKGFTET